MSSSAHAPALGVDLGGTKIEAVVLGCEGEILWRERVATPAGDYPATLSAIGALVASGRAAAGGGPLSIGIGAPGSLGASGLVKNANSTCLNGQAFGRDLQSLLGQPVALANDADCLALSEATDGAGAGAAVVFAVILGTGVGAGIAVHGRLLQGPNGLAGEWGHNPLPWPRDDERPGPACYCGARGCIETWLSGPAISADHARLAHAKLSAAAIAERAEQGDAACRATLDRHADRASRALATVLNLLDPDVVVLAGGVSLLPGLVGRIEAGLPRHVFGAALDSPRTRIVLARHGDASGVRGAACLGRVAGLGA